jgi:dTDP-4-dehydrorhamnose reductase
VSQSARAVYEGAKLHPAPRVEFWGLGAAMAARYLIIGGSGFVGKHLYAALGQANAIATYRKRQFSGGIAFDVGSMRLTDTALKQHHDLTHAFILHGVTAIDTCARDPAGTARINVTGTQRVIDDLVEHGITPVFASSDAVFDGSRGLWTEDDVTNPVLTYGQQKREVENYLLARTQKMLILRLSKVVGTRPGENYMLDDWPSKLEAGETIRCARDQVLSPISVDDAVEAFVRLAEASVGIFHVSGPEPVTRLSFLEAFIEETSRFRKVQARVIPRNLRDLQRDLNWVEPRPLNASMSPRKLSAVLGHGFDDFRTLCRKAAAARYAGRGRTENPGQQYKYVR